VALPLVLVCLLVLLQAGLVVARHVVTVHAAREAARAVAVDGRPGAAQRAAADAGGRDCRAAVSRPAAVGAVLTVRLTCPVATDVALVGPLVPDTTVTASASMRVER
jgi:hypothetical protein